MKLRDATVVVTGASSGIGAATAVAMATAGSKVVLLARTALALEEVADKIATAGGEAKTYTVDLSDVEAATATARMIEGEQGIPDVIVNNAGAGRWLATDETAPEQAVEIMAVPYFAAFALTERFFRA